MVSRQNAELLADLVIGGCMGTLLAPIASGLLGVELGIAGLGCTVLGAFLGAMAKRVQIALATS